MLQNLLLRPLSLSDDLNQVARLIYYTDNYVFPYLYNNDVERGVPVIVNMIQSETIYNYRNITIVVLDEKIVGIIVSQETPIAVDMGVMVRCFLDANEVVDERFTKTFNEYYKLFENEPEGVYIANVCVDQRYRGLGIGKKMIWEYINADPQKTYYLESVKNNIAALKIYQDAGFEIITEYLGFTDVPCYRMIRRGTKQG